MSPSASLNHAELVARATRWLRNTEGCGVVLSELVAYTGSGEVPDAIGFTSNTSVLVECKTTRSDFKADARKHFRQRGRFGMGARRYYMTPPGLIDADDLPEGWGLLYAEPKRVKRVRPSEPHEPYMRAERALLVSALRRREAE